MEIRNPTAAQRVVIFGRTGSGKTVFSCHLMSGRDFHRRPWVMLDVKGDELVGQIVDDNRVPSIDPTAKPPKKPGLYHLPYRPSEIDDIESFLWAVDSRAREKPGRTGTGLYIDEGYTIHQGQKNAITTILTQGRSLRVPVIANFQRPAWMSQHYTGNADFFAVFALTKKEDRQRVDQTISPAKGAQGQDVTANTRLPDYHCLWHDVGRDLTAVLRPAPPENQILSRFRERLGANKRTYI